MINLITIHYSFYIYRFFHIRISSIKRAANNYYCSNFTTFIGDTLNIPDSITGLTILAAGTSLPEAVSSVLVTNQGKTKLIEEVRRIGLITMNII